MSKVIQNIKLELHRGFKTRTLNPYLYKSGVRKEKNRKPLWTLVSVISHLRCSSTFIQNARNIRILGSSSAILLLIILSLTFIPVSYKTNEADATTGTATTSSTTITVNQATASIDLTAASADGTFATSEGAGIASFGVRTTNYTGYTLIVKSSDNAGTLVNQSGTGTFTSISQTLDEKTFDTSTYNGKWGYKPSKYNGIDNVAYWPSPTTTGTTLDITKTANSDADNTYTIALGARAAYTQPTGVYSKTVTLTATGNPSAYSITYVDDTGETIKNLPDITNGDATTTSIGLSSVTPSRTGYVFDGWCSVATTNSGKTCSGTRYTAGGSYGIDQTTSNVVTLHAIWAVPTYTITIKPTTGITSVSLNNSTPCTNTSGCAVNNLTYGQSYTLTATADTGYTFSAWSNSGAGTIANLTNASTTFTVGEGSSIITANTTISLNPTSTVMQNFTKSMCQTYATDHGIVLTDARDDHSYSVRYINGNCWMTSNLALGADLENPDSKTITLTKDNTNITDNSKSLTLRDLAANGTSGKPCYGTYDSGSGTGTGDGYTTPCFHTSNEGNSVWYNYSAATAGTITGTANTTEATQDICPAGWRLPTHAENQTIGNSSATYVNAFTPVYGGSYYDGTLYYATTYGYWWSSTASNGSLRYYLLYGSGLYTGNGNRRGGYYVRCVAK